MNVKTEIPHTSGIHEHESNENTLSEINEYDFTERIVTENNVTLNLFPSRRKKVKKVNMVIEGEFNISSVQFVKDNCQKLLLHFDMVNISLKNVIDIDLAAIQLLQVLKSSAAFMQKNITIESELSKDDKALLLSAGLMEIMSKRNNSIIQ